MKKMLCSCEAVLENGKLTLKNALIEQSFDGVDEIAVSEENNLGCSAPFMQVCAKKGTESVIYQMWGDLPLVRMLPFTDEYLYRLKGVHWVLKSVKLCAFTDDSDLLVDEHVQPTFRSGIRVPVEGELFFLEDHETEQEIVIFSETPDYIHGKLSIQIGKTRVKPGEDRMGGYVSLSNLGNPIVLGFCKKGEGEALCRNYYRHVNQRKELVTMSNTWGDAHGRDCVCHDFVMREIDAAREIGVDIVQIDDGWQINGTVIAAPRNPEGFRDFSEEDAWKINTERFPEGLRVITDYAAKDGIRVGMWMVPYSWNNFETLQRDCEVIEKAYREWGIRFFKLDMYQVRNEIGKQRLLSMLRFIYSLGNDVSVQMDITRHDRLNYLCGAQFGTIFVENRYTSSANYFPHRVLRHQWKLSRYLPLSRFQFELINPDRDTNHYNEGDPFVPSLYGMDYLFAAVMLSNPLFWMEMQFLSEQRRAEMAPVMAVWKQHRAELVECDVYPIGEEPTGRSLTGFAVTNEKRAKYLLLFREVTERKSAIFEVPELTHDSKLEVLSSNTEVTLEAVDGAIRASFADERAYAFIKVN